MFNDTNINEASINAKKRNIRNAIDVYKRKRKGFNGVRTFGVLTSENPDSMKVSNKENKKRLKSLSNYLKSANYVFVKQEGHFGGNDENSYFVFNIGLDTLKYYAGLFEQTSFIFGKFDGEEVVSYYYEKEDISKPYSKRLNDYIEKDKTTSFVDASDDSDYSIIGNKFKYRLPFSIFESVSDSIFNSFNNIDRKEDINYILEFTINRVGSSPYNYRKKIYKDMLNNNFIFESSINRIVHWVNNYEIALITAFRGRKENIVHPDLTKDDDKEIGESYSKKENKLRNRELSATLLRLGYGVTKVDGVYVENFGHPDSRICDEESFLVVNKNDDDDFFDNIFRLSEYYNQDCFCYKAKNDNVGYNVGTNGADYPGYGEEVRNGKFVVGVKNEFMTRLNNKGFAFTDEEDLDIFNTSHRDRKIERRNRRIESGINEELDLFENYSSMTKQTIANLAHSVISEIKK